MKFDYDSQNADIAHFGYRNDNNRVDLKVQGKNSVNSTFYNKEKKLLDVDVIQKVNVDDLDYPIYFNIFETIVYFVGNSLLNYQVIDENVTV